MHSTARFDFGSALAFVLNCAEREALILWMARGAAATLLADVRIDRDAMVSNN